MSIFRGEPGLQHNHEFLVHKTWFPLSEEQQLQGRMTLQWIRTSWEMSFTWFSPVTILLGVVMQKTQMGGRDERNVWNREFFTVLEYLLKCFTLIKCSQQWQKLFFFFPPFSQVTHINYCHQPSGCSLHLKDSDFGNTSWGSYEIAPRCINLKRKSEVK